MTLLQVAQHAEDLDRAARFYTRLLGAGPVATYDPPGLVFFRIGETRLLLERGAPAALLYLQVDDLPARIADLRDAGVEIDTAPHVIFSHEDGTLGPPGTDEWHAFVRDSEGNLIGLVAHTPSAG
jgi:methylmalonyl-CoA/ethylmalonyl-CoA epimerase